MGLTTFIYGLWDPRDGRLRYIGKSNNPKTRLTNHLRAARKKGATNHLRCWLIGVMNDGEKPMMEVLEEVPVSRWKETERDWINQCRDHGIDLVNIADGGLGGGARGRVVSEESRQKMRDRWADPEWRAKTIAAKNAGKARARAERGGKALTDKGMASFKKKRKAWAPMKGRGFTEEHKSKIGAANAVALAGRAPAEEVRIKGLEVRWSDPDAGERQAEAMEKYRDPETGQFLSREKVGG